MALMKLRDIPIGSAFQYQGQSFKKVNNMGEFFGACNVRTMKDEPALIHPDTEVVMEKENEKAI